MGFLWFGKNGTKEERQRQLLEDLANSKAMQRPPKKNEEVEAIYNSNLLLAGALINHDCLAYGKDPQEALESYTEVMELLRNWFTAKDTKDKLNKRFKQVLEDKWEVETADWPIKVRGIRDRE
ncbi:MAG: hypothetical protein SVY53_11430 [Chloroflexota bacterium]|nr:hypothetical protein [Chloroflexota bacterium]